MRMLGFLFGKKCGNCGERHRAHVRYARKHGHTQYLYCPRKAGVYR